MPPWAILVSMSPWRWPIGAPCLAILTLGVSCKQDEPPKDAAPATPAAASAATPLAAADPPPAEPPPTTCSASIDPIVPRDRYYLHVSDIHLDGFGDTSASTHPDTQPPLWAATQQALREVIACRPPAFVLFTGDLPGHFDCGPGECSIRDPSNPQHATFEHHADNVHTVLRDLAAVVGTTVPLLYVPGNNDSLGGDYYSFTADGITPFDGITADYPAVNAAAPCTPAWTGPCMVDGSHRAQGYYAARPVEGLRVIALDTVVLGTKYVAADGITQDDAASTQLEWLERQLAELQPGEKALLAMHIPPGIDAYGDTLMWGPAGASPSPWQDRFLAALAKASSAVIGLAYGHTHYDELRRIHGGTSSDAPVIEVAVSAPGITTNHGNRPAFKLVTLDDRLELTGFVTLHSTVDATTFGTAHYRLRDFVPSCTETSTLLTCLAALPGTDAVAEATRHFFYADPEAKPAEATTIVAGIPVFSGQTPP